MIFIFLIIVASIRLRVVWLSLLGPLRRRHLVILVLFSELGLEVKEVLKVFLAALLRLRRHFLPLLALEFFTHDEGANVVFVVGGFLFGDLVLGMEALVDDCFELWFDLQVVEDVIERSQDLSVIVLGEHFDQDPSVVVEHLAFHR